MADIDKSLPNVEQQINVPSEVEIDEAQLEKQARVDEEGNPVEIH
jgi:hypothetical protein